MLVEISLAGVTVRLRLRLPETLRYFSGFLTGRPCEAWDVSIPEDEVFRYPLICPSGVLDPYREFYMLMARTSAFLLQRNRVLIHGVSFLWQERAWLITAQSGVGKTTQLRHWQRLYGEEIQIINGDKTVLEQREDGSFWLHPSPWTGKEGDAGRDSGKLAGILLLRQEEENRICRLAPKDSVVPIYSQFLMLSDTEEETRLAGRLENGLLRRVPVWRLDNLGDEASARLTHDTWMEYLGEHETV